MTYNGKMYGLSYYADLITFQYNKKILKENGIAAPKTWDDVWSGMEKLADGGMKEPFAYEYDATLPNFWSAFVSQVYGRGGKMFDAKLNPVFNDPDSEAFKQLQWLQDAKKKGFIAYYPHETKVNIGMNTGQHAYTVMYHAGDKRFAAAIPYASIIVELDDAPGAFLVGNLQDAPYTEARVGRRVEVVFEPLNDDITLPQFRLAD
jgi:ABC-type glycerol-3-phosphate transport system substrate-binding protein